MPNKKIELKEVNLGNVLIVEEGNEFHGWYVQYLSENKKLRIRKVNNNEKSLSKLKYMRLIDKDEIIYVDTQKGDLQDNKKWLEEINRKRRIIVIPIKKYSEKKLIRKIFKNSVVELPKLRDYREVNEFVREIVESKGIECETKEVKDKLIWLMSRSTTEWESVLVFWDTVNFRGDVIKGSDLEELFPDSEFYSLDRTIFKILEGKIKYKNTKVMSYFLDVRNYSTRWMLRKIKEEVNKIGLFYQAYRGGVLLTPETSKRLLERIEGLGWKDGLPLTEIKEYEQRKYLEYVKRVPYRQFLKVAEFLYVIDEKSKDVDIYYLIEKVKEIRSGVIN